MDAAQFEQFIQDPALQQQDKVFSDRVTTCTMDSLLTGGNTFAQCIGEPLEINHAAHPEPKFDAPSKRWKGWASRDACGSLEAGSYCTCDGGWVPSEARYGSGGFACKSGTQSKPVHCANGEVYAWAQKPPTSTEPGWTQGWGKGFFGFACKNSAIDNMAAPAPSTLPAEGVRHGRTVPQR